MEKKFIRVDEELLNELRTKYPEWQELNNGTLVVVALRTFLKGDVKNLE